MTDTLLTIFTNAYMTVKRSRREPQLDDRLVEDLNIDSLDAIDMLSVMEGGLGEAFELEAVSENLTDVVTVSQLLDRIGEVVAAQGSLSA